MKIIRDGKEIELTKQEVEKAYREQEMNYKVMDMENVCDYMGIRGLEQGDYECLAEQYLDDFDCNLPENSQEENLVMEYATREKKYGRDIYFD